MKNAAPSGLVQFFVSVLLGFGLLIPATSFASSVAPHITSITQTDPSTSPSGTVHYTVTFDQAVTGVNTSAFSLTTTGVTGASVAAVTPISSAQYSVAVHTGTGTGTIILSVTGNSIMNSTGDKLPGGAFAPATSITFGANGPTSAVFSDVNGDGKQDIAVASRDAGSAASILFGNGDGTFGTSTGYAVDGQPQPIVAGDLNGDGKPDLATANNSNNTMSVLINNGDGTFAPQTIYTTGPEPSGIAMGDLNGDGKPDLVVTSQSGSYISVFINNGDGTFAPEVIYPVSFGSFSVAIADVNGDGKNDVVVSIDHGSTVSILLGNGDGTLQPQQSYAAGCNPFGLGVGDFNGDGKPDIAVSNQCNGNLTVLINNGDGTYGAPVTYQPEIPGVNGSFGIFPTDLNKDGKTDLVVGIAGPSGGVAVMFGNGDGTFGTSTIYAASAGRIDVADVNGDGRLDVVTPSTATTVSLLLGIPTGSIGPTYTIVQPTTAPLTVTADNKTMTLGGALPALTATLSGFTTLANDVTGTASCTTSATSGSPVGTYPITCTLGTLSSTNYTFNTFVAGILSVQYRWDGFLKPNNHSGQENGQNQDGQNQKGQNEDGHGLSVLEAGSTVAVKLQLKRADGTLVRALHAPLWLAPQKGSSINSPVDESLYTDPGTTGTAFKSDDESKQYSYSWKTKGLAEGYWYKIFVLLDDGTVKSTIVGLK